MTTVVLAITVSTNRLVQGPKTYGQYHFKPWALVDEDDAKEFLKLKAKEGCGCNSNVTEKPMFAKEDQIISGAVKTNWSPKSYPPPAQKVTV